MTGRVDQEKSKNKQTNLYAPCINGQLYHVMCVGEL